MTTVDYRDYAPYTTGAPAIWTVYANGEPHKLKIGVDLPHRSRNSARTSVYLWAKRYGYDLTYSPDRSNPNTLYVTLTLRDGEEPADVTRQRRADARKVPKKTAKRKPDSHPTTAFWRTHSDGRAFQVAYGPGSRFKNVNSLRASLAHYLHGKPLTAKTRTYLPGILTITITKEPK